MQQLLLDVLSGVITAAICAGFGILVLVIRNRRLEKELKATFKNHGIAIDMNGIGITLTNPTPYPVIVREVAAIVPDGGQLITEVCA